MIAFIPKEEEKLLKELPIISEWIKILSDTFLTRKKKRDKVEIFLAYGYFLTKKKNKDYENIIIDYSNILFEDRLNLELSKVRVDVTIKIGNLLLTNRLDSIPSEITKIVNEVTKVKMRIESNYHDNIEVIDSIPDIDRSIITIVEMSSMLNENEYSSLDIDNILDKINSDGVDSLTEEEKSFLDNKSKE